MFRRAGCVAALLWIFLPAVAEAETALQIVAHQDDDLYFINPAVSGSIARADSTWTVYVTAGDASRRLPQPPGGSTACDFVTYHWQCRELGMQAAYAAMAGVANSWVSPCRARRS